MTRSQKATEIERICKVVNNASSALKKEIIILTNEINMATVKRKGIGIIKQLEVDRNTKKKELFTQTRTIIQAECMKSSICPKFIYTIIHSK
ncbi:hypothetical protein BWK59_14005 [Flavobacterium davisii]|uniref:Uncharacterized protein n=1 Tax=Flavobacterium davisii TaxID=2906077 RepID=A0A246GF70_9FLAO|nr:hypothetical protein [Flavobacterium davisii]OWP82788.1 hypothetical protein BWK59_14005 [Flavobacterium davisii]